MENWREIEGFDGHYKISDLGNFKSFKTNIPDGKLMFPSKTKKGYQRIKLCRDGVSKTVSVHTLVMEAFVSKRPENYQVNHKNGIKDDNRLSNLEWSSPSENMLHSFQELAMGPGFSFSEGK